MRKILLGIVLCITLETSAMQDHVPTRESFFDYLIKEISQKYSGLASVLKDLEDVIDSDGLLDFLHNNIYKKHMDQNASKNLDHICKVQWE